MTVTIWKFPLEIIDNQLIHPPKGWEILSIQVQNGQITLWILCDPTRPKDSVEISIYGTGQEFLYRDQKFIGTCQIDGLVWHLFETNGLLREKP